MSFQVKNSLDVEFTKAPVIAIAGPSGSGKTESAMRLMRGYLGPTEKFLVIDTEEKRALYKKARYQPWDWLDFQPPFTPERYVEVLEIGKQFKGVVLDSGSHEYSGPGGLQDIQEETLERMSRGKVDRMEALSAPAWKDAKRRHKTKFMSYLIRYPVPLVICLRAEPKVKFVKVDGKTSIVDAGYQPICEKQFMFEMLVGAMMHEANAGVPNHIKELETDLKPVFVAGQQIDEATGRRLRAWADGRTEKPDLEPRTAGIEPFTDNELNTMREAIKAATTMEELKTRFGAPYAEAGRRKDRAARNGLKASYDARKADLEALAP
jgi:energy-coupling factor transporter ATP-binding protein EcfA2